MIKRNILETLENHLLTKKTICLLIGARQTGKTTLMKLIGNRLKSEKLPHAYLSFEDPELLLLCNEHPENLFKFALQAKNGPRFYFLLDEVQYLDNPSNFLKYLYDTYSDSVRFFVSGSSSFYIDEKFTDSLAGRKRLFNLDTVSFREYLVYREFEEAEAIHTGRQFSIPVQRRLDELLDEYAVYGGYPEVILTDDEQEKQDILTELADSYVKKDALEAGVTKTDKYVYLMRILSTQIGSLFNSNECAGTLGINRLTVDSYIRTMRLSCHITVVKPFFSNLRKELTKMPKIYFNDHGLRNRFYNDFSPFAVRPDKGALLEQTVFRFFLDLYREEDIAFWRTAKQHEVDFIIRREKAYEIKWSDMNFSASKYKTFTSLYPEIPLRCISRDNAPNIKI